jgi:hypothetical protein
MCLVNSSCSYECLQASCMALVVFLMLPIASIAGPCPRKGTRGTPDLPIEM